MVLNRLYASLPVLVVLFAIFWSFREPKFDWKPMTPLVNYPLCPTNTKEAHLLFGGTSMLGRHIVESWKREFKEVCLINYGRNKCDGCDVSIIGDLRDSRHIERLLKHYNGQNVKQKIATVVLSVKPALEGTHWRTFMEINYSAIVEIVKLAKANGVKDLLYVSSIAASSHYVKHHLSDEKTPQPLYTDYEAPYDLTKRIAEDYVLAQNEKDKSGFHTAALRVSGILGGDGEPFFHHRMFPFQMTFNNPVIVDYGYAGNIADALVEMQKTMKKDSSVSGEFYYFTGEHIYENVTAAALSELTGKPVITIPYSLMNYFLQFWQWFRWDHNTYTLIDLLRCANVEQTFDQSKFHKTFPNFKAKYTVVEALKKIYGKPGK